MNDYKILYYKEGMSGDISFISVKADGYDILSGCLIFYTEYAGVVNNSVEKLHRSKEGFAAGTWLHVSLEK